MTVKQPRIARLLVLKDNGITIGLKYHFSECQLDGPGRPGPLWKMSSNVELPHDYSTQRHPGRPSESRVAPRTQPYPRTDTIGKGRMKPSVRRDPLNNPADLRLEPVAPTPTENLCTPPHSALLGPVRTEKHRGVDPSPSNHTSQRSRRITVPLHHDTDAHNMDLALQSLPVSQLPSGVQAQALPSPRSDQFTSALAMPAEKSSDYEAADITAHIDAEVDLFDAMDGMDDDDADAEALIRDGQHPTEPVYDTSYDTTKPWGSTYSGDASRIRKRSIGDDGSSLHGRGAGLRSSNLMFTSLSSTIQPETYASFQAGLGNPSSSPFSYSNTMAGVLSSPCISPSLLKSPPLLFPQAIVATEGRMVLDETAEGDENEISAPSSTPPRQEETPTQINSSIISTNPNTFHNGNTVAAGDRERGPLSHHQPSYSLSAENDPMNIDRGELDVQVPLPSLRKNPANMVYTPDALRAEHLSGSSHIVPSHKQEMVDVTTFNRTMHHLGRQAFLHGLEEGRKTANTTSPAAASSVGTPNSSGGRGKQNRSNVNNADSDDDGDDESAHLKGRKSRKSTGKRVPNDVLLMLTISKQGIRAFMKEQGLSHERGGDFPEEVSSSDLAKFVSEGNSAGPVLASNGNPMRIEWKKSTKTSQWNGRVLSILSAELHRLLREGKVAKVKYDSKVMTVKYCEKQIKQRLDRLRREKISHDENRLADEQDRIDQVERHRSRRKTRFNSRLQVSKRKAKGGADEVWSAILQIIQVLKLDGMSGDETVSEDVFGHRVVRRLNRPWMSDRISSLMTAVDTYVMESKDMAGIRKRGNPGLTRETISIKNDERPHMVNLPQNFYNSEWYRSLDEYEKIELNVQSPMDIPIVEQYVRPGALL